MRIHKINEICLEYLAYWESGLKAALLAKILGQSREHVQRHTISAYEQTYPVRLISAGKHLRKLAGTSDDLRFAPTKPSDLIRMLDGIAVLSQNDNDSYPFGVRVENALDGVFPEPNAEVFRALYAACAQNKAVMVQYHAKSGVFPMHFSPHALAQTLERVHFRGYARWSSELNKGSFIDLVPARVLSIEAEMLDNAVPGSADSDWHQRETATFQLAPSLPKPLAELVLEEWAASLASDHSGMIMRIPNLRKPIRPYVERGLRYRFFGNTQHEVWVTVRQTQHQFGQQDG